MKKPEEKKATTKKRKEANILKQNLITENNKPIDEYIKLNARSMKVKQLIDSTIEKFGISKHKANDRVKAIRKKLGLYQKGSDRRSDLVEP